MLAIYYLHKCFQGVIWLSGQLNREATQSYRLTVMAKDNPASITEQKVNQTNIQIVITDINDCAPKFSLQMYNNSVPEDIQQNSLVIQTTAADDDQSGTSNSKVIYEIITGNNDNLFEIGSETGQIRNKVRLRGHVGNYTLTVMAKDLGDPQLNGTALANIAITDKNDNNPVIVGKPASNTVKTYEVSEEVFFPHNTVLKNKSKQVIKHYFKKVTGCQLIPIFLLNSYILDPNPIFLSTSYIPINSPIF